MAGCTRRWGPQVNGQQVVPAANGAREQLSGFEGQRPHPRARSRKIERMAPWWPYWSRSDSGKSLPRASLKDLNGAGIGALSSTGLR